MFWKIAEFFIKNSKLTIVLVLVTLITGLWSYFILAKQYNPTIVVPAFQVMVPSPWLEADEISKIVVSPLENKIMELEWIDEVYGVAWDNYWAVMAKFHVWVDKEKAKIWLIQKIRENMILKPLGVQDPIINTIDPDELAQIVYSISIKWDTTLTQKETYIYLRQVANIIKDKLKTIENVTTLDIVGGYKKDLIVELNLAQIESKNVDIMQVYQALKKNNISLPSGDITSKSGTKIFVETLWRIETKKQLEKLVIWNFDWNIVYLEDIAKIKLSTRRIDKISSFSNSSGKSQMVLLGIGKALWTNAVFVTEDIQERMKSIQVELPKNIELTVISNQWEKAKLATNMLLVNLVQSVVIVFFVLMLYLWAKNAFNTAVSIPLTLWAVFVIAFIAWENINKITLFALILVLGMLVDNSTVVVENIARHLQERVHTGNTKLQAVLQWTQEVWFGVILSTLTRLLAFGSMFAVSGMMWEYMKPIPQFAIRALLVSLAIAFSINPWISYISAKDVTESDRDTESKQKESPLKIRKKYLSLMKVFLGQDKKHQTRRTFFKIFFWLSLFAILILPITFWIFKARMLPKSNQNQIYVWIDAPRDYSAERTALIEKDVSQFLVHSWTGSQNQESDIDYVENISSTIGQSYIWDFANLFRGGLNRVWENQVSMRVNLFSPEIYEERFWKARLNSENITISLREKLRAFVLAKYPDVKIQLLEDPPGPPVKATFLIKLKSNANPEDREIFISKVQDEVYKISREQKLVDVYNSQSSSYKKLKVQLDLESISRAWLSSEQVEYSLWIILHWKSMNLIKNSDSFEPTNIIIWTQKQEVETIEALQKIAFTNTLWDKIPLSSIAKIEYSFVSPELYSDHREVTDYIYAEMWDNSLIYPVIKLIWKYISSGFREHYYSLESWDLYHIWFKWLKDWKDYILEWGGEWELTMDTFRDLWIAMMISLLAIYFVLVWQFRSFWIAGVIMITFLLWFFGVWPGFTLLYLLNNEYFSATSMIWVIALAWIVVWNAIILIDYINVLKKNGLSLADALLKAWYVRFAPIVLTSLTTVFWAMTIIGDPVWSGLAWTIIWGLSISSVLTLIVIPIFYYESQKNTWK